jgi:hypothetical protein
MMEDRVMGGEEDRNGQDDEAPGNEGVSSPEPVEGSDDKPGGGPGSPAG